MFPALTNAEIEIIESQIDEYTLWREKIASNMRSTNISMEEYYKLELELVCCDHDLEVYNYSLRVGYDAMKHGPIYEDTEANWNS